MMQNAVCTKNVFLAVNDAKHSLHQKCCLSSRFRVTVMTKAVLTKPAKPTQEEDEKKEGSKGKEKDVKVKKRSHHKTRKCPICKKHFKELKKHLKVHANRDHIEQQEIERVFSISYKRATKRGPPLEHKITQKGLSYKWCPVKGCKKVVTYLRSHLQYVHKMKKFAEVTCM